MRRRPWLVLALLALVLAAALTACGGDDDEQAEDTTTAETEGGETTGAEGETLKIGHLSTCEGPFAVFYDATTAGAVLPLIQRGATPNGEKGSDGVANATVAGHPVEMVWGCSDATPDVAVA